VKRLIAILLFALSLSGATPDNDASCEIAQLPAATLLLPYFEVDLDDAAGETTVFTVTNVTSVEQIAHVTLWTDHAVPVIDFEIFLTGYDVQSINLHDVLALGAIAPPFGTGFERRGSPLGTFSDEANPLADEQSCRDLPRSFTAEERERMRLAFTRGIAGDCTNAGRVHDNAIGYATIDVVRACFAPMAGEGGFIERLSFDNVLTGDYAQVHPADRSAQGGPLVHIRAVPEGGGATPFARTFYSAYQRGDDRTADARQPLPSTFAAHWIDGGPGGFETKLKVWREKTSGRPCEALPAVMDVVRFNENGQSTRFADALPRFPATSLVNVRDPALIPANAAGDFAGWTYLNFGAQAWVVSSMRAEGRFSVDVEATALGTGCSFPPERNAPVRPVDEDDSCDVSLLPAATLLLPYWEVDPSRPDGENTLFTVTNTSAQPRIAHVTLWTDYAFPVIGFDVALGAYDTQSISLYDVIVHGRVPAACGPNELPQETRERLRRAFTFGLVPPTADSPRCNNIGSSAHRNQNAVGYATVDLVESCTNLSPADAQYYDGIAFDNVLTGDYQQLHAGFDFAQGTPLVHIRATNTRFERTFYGRFTNRDARQPLPSAFAARWINGGTGAFTTTLTAWLDGLIGTGASCGMYAVNVREPRELVTFDEEENAAGIDPNPPCGSVCPLIVFIMPNTGAYEVSPDTDTFATIEDAVGGWIYLNLADPDPDGGRQAWVTSVMRAEGRYSVEGTSTALGNGCSAAAPKSEIIRRGDYVIGPAPNENER
jgi:hypothetical protein